MLYRGEWYDTHDVQVISRDLHTLEGDKLREWHGILSDSFFSGILFRFVGEDLDEVVCGTYFS